MFYKDIIVQIALKLSLKDLYKYSISCKKIYNMLWNSDSFWKIKMMKSFNYLEETDNREIYISLEKIKKYPSAYYRRELRKGNNDKAELYAKIYRLHFPYIGVLSKTDSEYFGIFDIYNFSYERIVPNHVVDIKDVALLSIFHHAKSMGIKCYFNETAEVIVEKIKEKLIKLNVIYYIGDDFDLYRNHDKSSYDHNLNF